MQLDPSLDDLAVSNFRNYLRIPSVQPDVNYDEAIAFLEGIAKSLDLQVRIYQYFPKKPILIITWLGKQHDLPSIMLNSHMDVVPVFEEKWTHKPFDAHMDENGNIYARGAQDTKATGIQYLEAIRRLKQNGVTLKRTIHVSFVPDEEIGGIEGMKPFAASDDFKRLNVGFAIDEGYASPDDSYYYFNGERAACQMKFHCPGKTMHGCLLAPDSAGEKVRTILERLYDFRSVELSKLKSMELLGDVTSINVTILEGGVQANVVPPEFTITVDCRVSVYLPMKEFEQTLQKWCNEAGEDVWVEFIQKEEHFPVSKIDHSNPYWVSFIKAAEKMNIKFKQLIMPATTDIRYVRSEGIPAFGFSPMNHSTILAHAHDEFLNVKVFLKGIDVFYGIINELGNTFE